MDGEQIKQAYLKLQPQERREVAHWILARELSGRAGASLQPAHDPLSGRSISQHPYKKVISVLALAILVLTFCGGAFYWITRNEQARKKERLEQTMAEEARRPNSPTNLAFLEKSIGKEVIIRGVPLDCEVGFLYFSKVHKKALRLNLLVGGVVLLQSGELEDLVRKKQELEIQGTLEKTDEGYYQISVPATNRLKKIGN